MLPAFFVFGKVAPAAAEESPTGFWTTVRWVDDGDTVVLADGRRVRYLGINCPEVAHRDQAGEPFGIAARRLNRSLVAGRRVRLEPAGQGKDRYGRLLADVFLAEGTFVNGALVAAGLAHVLAGPGPEPRASDLLEAQRGAMAAGEGMWRRLRREALPLVGNRRSRRFHRPDCPFGKKTVKRRRVAFPDLAEAFKAGYAPCKHCFGGLAAVLTAGEGLSPVD